MILVFDTSTLQAVHRAGLCNQLQKLSSLVVIPRAVSIETAVAFKALGAVKVPFVPGGASGVHAIMDVVPQDAAALVTPLNKLKKRERLVAEAALRRGKLLCHGRVIDEGEFEVVALAKRLGGVAIMSDKQGIRCAEAAGVKWMDDEMILSKLAVFAGISMADVRKRLEKLDYYL